MGDALAILGLAAATFVSTNIDDLVVLALFFSNRAYRPGRVVTGQYLGIGLLVALSIVLAFVAEALSTGWLHWLGVLPVAIGLKWLLDLRRPPEDEDETPPATAPRGQVVAVAVVTIANGGDNVGVYTPMFASQSVAEVAAIAIVFAVLTGVWCLLSFALTRHPLLKDRIARFGRVVAPFVLIAIGVGILLEA